jgi:hypothetical protein
MTVQLESKITSIIFSVLVTFAIIAGQPYSSNASEQLDQRDEMMDTVYTPLWMGDPLLKPQGEVKAESQLKSSKQLNHRDEMMDNVYTPLWMGDPLPTSQGRVKAKSNLKANDQLDHRDEMINNVYTPLWMGPKDPSH